MAPTVPVEVITIGVDSEVGVGTWLVVPFTTIIDEFVSTATEALTTPTRPSPTDPPLRNHGRPRVSGMAFGVQLFRLRAGNVRMKPPTERDVNSCSRTICAQKGIRTETR